MKRGRGGIYAEKGNYKTLKRETVGKGRVEKDKVGSGEEMNKVNKIWWWQGWPMTRWEGRERKRKGRKGKIRKEGG